MLEQESLDLTQRKASLYESQETKNRIEIAERLRQLIPADEVEAFFARITQLYVDALESIPSRIDADPRTVAGVESEVRAARRDLARAVSDAARELRGHPADPDAAEH